MLFITTLLIIDEEDYFYRIHAVSAMCKDADVRSWYNSFGAIHKRRLLRGQSPILLSKKTTKWEGGGVIKSEKWADDVYG